MRRFSFSLVDGSSPFFDQTFMIYLRLTHIFFSLFLLLCFSFSLFSDVFSLVSFHSLYHCAILSLSFQLIYFLLFIWCESRFISLFFCFYRVVSRDVKIWNDRCELIKSAFFSASFNFMCVFHVFFTSIKLNPLIC